VVEDRLADGRRIAELLASEVEGDRDRVPGLGVVDADPEVDPTPDGTFAYAIARESPGDVGAGGGARSGERIAEAYLHPDRVRLEVRVGVEAAATAAGDRGLRVRPKAVEPPRTLVFVEDGAAVKRVVPVLRAAVDAADADGHGADGRDATRGRADGADADGNARDDVDRP
jgi:hypothetical protein